MSDLRTLIHSVYHVNTDNLVTEIENLISDYRPIIQRKGKGLDERDVALITYGDSILSKDKPLKTLHQFLEDYLKELTSIVHILPFYPWTSDDGFAVKDYQAVNPELGSWDDIQNLAENYRLMFDAVVNHMSSQAHWLEEYLNNKDDFQDFFIRANRNADWSKVVRPRVSDLFHDFTKADGTEIKLWTTFSRDQVDLNFKNPKVFLRILEVLLFYLSRGATLLRLDAIGFMWKEEGTSCIHLPQTHALIKAARIIVNQVSPQTLIITETNVPHQENISYFGNGTDEAHLVYNFTLPPLLAYSLLTGNSKVFSQWVAGLKLPGNQVCFFNFLASHDGVGVRPLDGILPKDEVRILMEAARANGGLVSYKKNPDGTDTPYEVNCNYLSLLYGKEVDADLGKLRFILAHALLLSMPGLPALYIHSLLGSLNDLVGVENTGRNRSINREKLEMDTLISELLDPDHRRYYIYKSITELIRIRKIHRAFHPYGSFQVIDSANSIFVLRRSHDNEIVDCVYNFSQYGTSFSIANNCMDLLSEKEYQPGNLEIPPCGFMWLRNHDW